MGYDAVKSEVRDALKCVEWDGSASVGIAICITKAMFDIGWHRKWELRDLHQIFMIFINQKFFFSSTAQHHSLSRFWDAIMLIYEFDVMQAGKSERIVPTYPLRALNPANSSMRGKRGSSGGWNNTTRQQFQVKIRYFWDSISSVAAKNEKKIRKRIHFKVLSFTTTLSCTPCAACQPTIFCCFIGSNVVLLGAIPDSLSRALSSGCTISVKQEQFCAFFTDEFEGLQIIVATWNRRKHVHRK